LRRLAEPFGEPMQGDEVAHLLGGLCQKTKFGEHLTIRNWYSTPEFAEPAAAALDLLARNKDESISRKTRAALENPEKWLSSRHGDNRARWRHGHVRVSHGNRVGGTRAVFRWNNFFMRDFSDEHSGAL